MLTIGLLQTKYDTNWIIYITKRKHISLQKFVNVNK